MKTIIKNIVSRLSRAQETAPERAPEKVLEIDTERVLEHVVDELRMRTIFPHQPVLTAGDSYGDWYARVADVWQRRRQQELQEAPTDDLQHVINSVMRHRIDTAQAAATTLH